MLRLRSSWKQPTHVAQSIEKLYSSGGWEKTKQDTRGREQVSFLQPLVLETCSDIYSLLVIQTCHLLKYHSSRSKRSNCIEKGIVTYIVGRKQPMTQLTKQTLSLQSLAGRKHIAG